MLKLHEQRHWGEAYELQTRFSRLRKDDDSLGLGFLQCKIGEEAVRAGQSRAAEKRSAPRSRSDARVFQPTSGSPTAADRDPVGAARALEKAIEPCRSGPSRLSSAWRGPTPRRGAFALRCALRAPDRERPARLARRD